MNTKLFLIASSLLMTMNCVNIGQAMEDNYNNVNQEQQPKTKLDLKKQELDTKINEFMQIVQFEDRNFSIEYINNIADVLINFGDLLYNMRTGFFSSLTEFFEFICQNNIIIDELKQHNIMSFCNTLGMKIQKLDLDKKDKKKNEELYWIWYNILYLKSEIEYLKQHPEKNKPININEDE